ncbi:MAG: septum formation initiator family protein [Acidimicrobiales bacterium]|nr:septum formation initiator family protein [Acidimicrobiales bacterium]
MRLPSGVVRWAKPLLLAAAAVVTIVALAVSVFPTRTWIDQGESLAEVEAELDALGAERESLEKRIAELDDDATIEAIARSQYGLVRPGEEAYAIHPAPARPVDLPPVWPFGELQREAPASGQG